jgi:hypothetical protein
MDANLHFNNPFHSAEPSQHLVDVPSPSDQSNVAPTCVHIREEDSHCEQCRQQIRRLSRSMLPQSSQFALSPTPTPTRHSTDLSSTRGADVLRQRRRASHCPSASDPSMSSLSSSLGKSSAHHPWRQSRGLHQHPMAASQLRGLPESANSPVA